MATPEPNTHELGIWFAQVYYNGLSSMGDATKEVSSPYGWFFDTSVYTEGVESVNPPTHQHVAGRENIDLGEGAFAGVVQLNSVDCQSSVDGSLVILVVGNVKADGQEAPRSFAQTFFLAKWDDGYYVRNCILRWLNPTPVTAATPAPAATEPVAQTQAQPQQQQEVEEQVEAEPEAAEEEVVVVEEKQEEKAPVANKRDKGKAEELPQKDVEVATDAPKEPKKAPAKQGKPSSFLDAARRQPVKPAVKQTKKPHGRSKAQGRPEEHKESRRGGERAHKRGDKKEDRKPSEHRRERRAPPPHINAKAQCYVSNIPFDSTDSDLLALLKTFGPVKKVVRPQGKGYGFVEYASDADAAKAIASREALKLDGRELKVVARAGKDNSKGGRGQKRNGSNKDVASRGRRDAKRGSSKSR